MSASKQFGDKVLPAACSSPLHEAIQGHHVQLIPTQPEHFRELYEVVGGSEKAALYDYMPYGPFDDIESLQERIVAFATSKDPLFWTICQIVSGRLLVWLSLLRIDAANRVAEIGHILYTPQLQRTTAATEAWYLLADKVVRSCVSCRV